jgi:hypothetical protein
MKVVSGQFSVVSEKITPKSLKCFGSAEDNRTRENLQTSSSFFFTETYD